MRVEGDRVDRESIGELFSRAADEGKAYVSAQVEVVKQTATTGIDEAKVGVGLVVVGGLLAYAGLIVILVALFAWLADEIGPVLSGLVVAGVTLATALLMLKVGIGRITAAVAVVSGNGKLK